LNSLIILVLGPTGIPAMDCMNGYSEVLNSEESTILGAPLDHAALNVDFDFASNLALFDKKVGENVLKIG
jgi:hypothetical protein